ncbi:integral membrane protein-like protein [Lentithecium fluviatile CBS 122367]|uniref:Integral membrane protein-like protein n=1 Tax=Lentithecium fluviatile CBS 122367 TaxID=1168545 RepID=A0A6G1IX64_9PLEO|nr:integral membrane protein-like protein [Lentithecium fluviatile CBS 122367]
MRLSALLPALCCTAALILSFLCLFAGHKKGFMEDYHVMTLNTSRIGEGVVNSTLGSSDSPLSSLWNLVPDSIQNDVGEAAGAVTEQLGIEDFYSAHLLDYCYGQFTPAEAANSTLSLSDIHKSVTGCSNQTAMFWFDPEVILEQALNKTGLGITLDDLEWPEDIQRGLDALRIVSITSFVLYCIAIALIFVALVAALPAIFAAGRLAACLNLMVTILAFLAIGLASALVTAVSVKGSSIINQYGNDIGVQANRGNKFLALTWVATALMFITLVTWSVELCFGHRKRQTYAAGKHG